MKSSVIAIFSACFLALTSPAFAGHVGGLENYGWWTPLLVLIAIGLAMVLWDEFTRSMYEVRKFRKK